MEVQNQLAATVKNLEQKEAELESRDKLISELNDRLTALQVRVDETAERDGSTDTAIREAQQQILVQKEAELESRDKLLAELNERVTTLQTQLEQNSEIEVKFVIHE